jgi:hypothetical protein
VQSGNPVRDEKLIVLDGILPHDLEVRGRCLGVTTPCKKIPVIPINKGVDDRRIIGICKGG